MTLRLASALLAAALLATACGFSPLYAERAGVSQALNDISVASGEGRTAYLLRQQLIERLGARGDGGGAYLLETTITEQRRGFGVRIDDVATRYEIALSVAYTLRRQSDGSVAHKGVVQGAASFDTVSLAGGEQPYGDIAAEEKARERAAAQAADGLRLDLSFHFAKLASR